MERKHSAFANSHHSERWLQAQVGLFAAIVGTTAASNALVAALWARLLIEVATVAKGEHRMDEVERDGTITINVGFGNISFYKDPAGSYAHAIVDLSLKAAEDGRKNQIQTTMRFACKPEVDSVQSVVQQGREHLLTLLRAAVQRIEAESAESLLFQEEGADTNC